MSKKICRNPANLIPLLLLSACEPTLIAEFQDIPVVEAYLYSDAPASVKISKLIPYRNDVTFSDEDVDRLHMEIVDETEDMTYTLLPQGNGLYVDSTLLPKVGHSYRLRFAYNETEVTALTQVAAAPENVTVSPLSTSVTVWDTTSTGGGFGGGGMPSMPANISIEWSNPTGDYYIIVVDNVDENPIAVRDTAAPLSFLVDLTQDSIAQLSSQQFSYTGRHIVRLCRVQPEYVVMAQANSSSSSEPLIEVHANIINGFGIFTGISRYNTDITVHKN
ncbi:MAG: DUF4249 domain-containing protein [Prevotellaceae bacterium]|jgi:hypothetical protein|nr:DUF4249 domain-containing protein [Prevotellaceae bacterium]